MANDWNNVKPVGCKHWLVLPAVYSDALSYGDQIAHFCAALNKLIQNNNTLPEYIQQMIQDYINGDVIGEVVQNIVSQFILNVKYPPENLKPAVGDGSADDTEAIQGCINYAKNHNGMAVYIPSGAYSVQSLTLPGDVSLFGFDRYTTKLVLRGGATTPMISSVGTGFSIIGLTLDGNAGVQVEDINILSLISQDVLLSDLIIKDGYQLLIYNGTGGHLQMDNIVFGNTVNRCINISGNSIVQAKNLRFTHLSAVSGIDVINVSSDGGMYDFISNVTCDTCLSVSGNDNYFIGLVSGATTPYVDSGLRNTIDLKGDDKKEYYSGDTDTAIEGDFSLTSNGAYSENISGAFTSVRNSTESKVVSGASTEQYNSTQTENITGKKTINAQDIHLNPINPLQYKTPENFNNTFKTIPFKDINNVTYNVLVAGKNYIPNYYYNTLSELQNDTQLNIGDIVLTLGFYTFNDGGGGLYLITDDTPNEMNIIEINENLSATLLVQNFINVKQLGANETNDIGAIVNQALTIANTIYIPAGTYTSKTTIRIGISDVVIFGDGMYNTIIKYPNNYTDHTCIRADTRINDTTLKNITICNLGFDGNRDNFSDSGYANSNSTCINTIALKSEIDNSIRNIEDTHFYNLLIENFSNSGIHLHGDWLQSEGIHANNTNRRCYIENCVIRNLGVNNVRGSAIVFSHSEDCVVDHCYLSNTGQENMTNDNCCFKISVTNTHFRAANGGAGTHSLDTCQGFYYSNNYYDGDGGRGDLLAGQHVGIVVNDNTGFSYGVIDKCIFRNYSDSYGIWIKSNDASDATEDATVSISDCLFYGAFVNFIYSSILSSRNGGVSVKNCLDLYGKYITVGTANNNNTTNDSNLTTFIDLSTDLSLSAYKTTQYGLNLSGSEFSGFQKGLYLVAFEANSTGSGTITLNVGSTNYTRTISEANTDCNMSCVGWISEKSTISVVKSGLSTTYPRLLIKYLGNYST